MDYCATAQEIGKTHFSQFPHFWARNLAEFISNIFSIEITDSPNRGTHIGKTHLSQFPHFWARSRDHVCFANSCAPIQGFCDHVIISAVS